MIDRDVERFDRRAAGYEREWLQPRFFAPVRRSTLDVAASLVPRPRSVLDVGCGTGALLRLARERFPAAQLAGIDPAPAMIAEAAEGAIAVEFVAAGAPDIVRAGAVEFVRAGAERIPFGDASFELVLSTLSLHHWADRGQGIREIARVLAPGGAVVLADRFLPRGVDALVRAAGLRVAGRPALFSLGPLTIVSAVCARQPSSER